MPPSLNSVQFSCSVVYNSLRLYGLQHTRLPYPSPTPGACSNSYPSSGWCHPTISSSVIPFSSCLQSFLGSGSFLMSRVFSNESVLHIRWPSIRLSASASVLPMYIQDWFPLGWTGWISLQSKGLLRVFSNTTVQKHQFFGSAFFMVPTLTSILDPWKNHSFDCMDLCRQSDVSVFNTLSKFVMGLPRWLSSKESACEAEDAGGPVQSVGWEGGHGNPLQYSCLENPMDRRVWQAIVHGVTKSGTWLKQVSMHALGSSYLYLYLS